MIAEFAVLTLFPMGLWIGGKLAGFTITAASMETVRIPLILFSSKLSHGCRVGAAFHSNFLSDRAERGAEARSARRVEDN